MLLRWCFGSCSLSISCTLNNVFSPGLQVWSTASGKEQDRDKDTFPRSDSFNFVSILFSGLLNWYVVLTFYLCCEIGLIAPSFPALQIAGAC